jgi:hypothetical protein
LDLLVIAPSSTAFIMGVDRALKVAVSDFWDGFDPTSDVVVNALLPSGFESVDIVDVASADLVIHSVFGVDHLRAGGTVVAYSGETLMSMRSAAQWSIDWRFIDEVNHLRLPLWVAVRLNDPIDFDRDRSDPASRRFCNFVFGNGRCPTRNAFFEALHRREPVDSLGRVYNNTTHPALSQRDDPSWHRSKLGVLGEYKFTIAFENSEHVGYTTEKLIDAWLADTVPIYWGNPGLGADLPVGACLSLHEAGSMAKLVDQVLEVHHDPVRYEEIRQANPFRTGEIHDTVKRFAAELSEFGTRIHADAVRHAGSRRVSTPRRMYNRLPLIRPQLGRTLRGLRSTKARKA